MFVRIFSVIENVEHLCDTKRNNGDGRVWTWDQIVVCIIADGQSAVHEETLQLLTLVRPRTHVSA